MRHPPTTRVRRDAAAEADPATAEAERATAETDRTVSDGDAEAVAPDAASRWHSLTGFQRDCLQAMAEDGDASGRPPSGQDLLDRLEARYDGPLNHSRLYQNLDDLVGRGFVAREVVDGRTNGYRLTRRGRAAVEAAARLLGRWVDAEAVGDGS